MTEEKATYGNDQKQETPHEEAPLQCAIGADGVMTIKADLSKMTDENMFCLFRGFMDSKRDQGLQIINQIRLKRAELSKPKIFDRVFNGLLKRK